VLPKLQNLLLRLASFGICYEELTALAQQLPSLRKLSIGLSGHFSVNPADDYARFATEQKVVRWQRSVHGERFPWPVMVPIPPRAPGAPSLAKQNDIAWTIFSAYRDVTLSDERLPLYLLQTAAQPGSSPSGAAAAASQSSNLNPTDMTTCFFGGLRTPAVEEAEAFFKSLSETDQENIHALIQDAVATSEAFESTLHLEQQPPGLEDLRRAIQDQCSATIPGFLRYCPDEQQDRKQVHVFHFARHLNSIAADLRNTLVSLVGQVNPALTADDVEIVYDL